MSVKIPCRYGFDHEYHEYPNDWIFGGANGEDPRADPRWKPTTYFYYDFQAQVVWMTQTPLCDDQAIDEFTKIKDMGLFPKWLGKAHREYPVSVTQRVDTGSSDIEMLPVVYDFSTDTVTPREQE